MVQVHEINAPRLYELRTMVSIADSDSADVGPNPAARAKYLRM